MKSGPMIAAVAALLSAGLALAADPPPIPAWLYPTDPPAPAGAAPDTAPDTPKVLPGTSKSYTTAQIRDLFNPPDWRPDQHPPMPDVVAHGHKPDQPACAGCHFPNGQGRPENTALAGLDPAYLARQLADFKSGDRKSSNPATNRMAVIVRAASDVELTDAVRYFSSQKYQPWIRVVETDTVQPTHSELRFLVPSPGPKEPIGHRIVETVSDLERNMLRDPAAGFIAYVPVGSIDRGQDLVTGKISSRTVACATCHGADLRGVADIPPLAGRSPSYIARQLYDFQHGARHGANSAPMQAVVANLTEDDLIAIGAYLGSRAPH